MSYESRHLNKRRNERNILTRGFTLVEAMIAISILSIAITGPLLIAQKGVASAVYARDQITAFYLAQEAVEYIRNVRDSNRLSGAEWLNGLDECKQTGLSPTKKCQIDAHFTNFTAVDAIEECGGTCEKLSYYKNAPNRYYGYGSGAEWIQTPFTRTVTINNTASANKEALVTVEIAWKTNVFEADRVFTIKEFMFNF